MKTFALMVMAVALVGVGSGAALGQGRGGHPPGGSGPSAGAPHGGGGGPGGGGVYRGGPSGGGAYHGGYGGGRGWQAHGGGHPTYGYGGWHSGGHPTYGYRGWYGGWYGSNFGVYFGAPWLWGAYAYPYRYLPGYYPYSAYTYPYPPYAYGGPTVYIQRPRIVASAPPPPPRTPPAAAKPAPAPERYSLAARELFAFDSARLTLPQPKLDEIALALVRHPGISGVRISGYTDRLGAETYNRELSQRRADAVKDYLVGKGVDANRLVAIGYGEANPVVTCNDTSRERLIACLEPNRRVEIEPIVIEQPAG